MYDVQCQIELPKLVSELDSNQLVTNSLLVELNYFLEVQHQLIDNYRAAYTAGNTSLEDVANGIPYDVISSTISTKKVRSFMVVGRTKVGKICFLFSAMLLIKLMDPLKKQAQMHAKWLAMCTAKRIIFRKFRLSGRIDVTLDFSTCRLK